MNKAAVKRELARMGFDDFLDCILSAAVTRGGETSTTNTIRGLVSIIKALSGGLRDNRGAVACELRDIADICERPLFTVKTKC